MLPPTNTLRIAACLLGDTVAWPVRRLTRAFSQLFRGRREHSRGGAMGVSIMRVEARDGRYHIALAACVLGILTLLMLVIGVAGPQQTGYQVNSAYNCTSDDDNHRGNALVPRNAAAAALTPFRTVRGRRGARRGADV